jgi:hypothetical protein
MPEGSPTPTPAIAANWPPCVRYVGAAIELPAEVLIALLRPGDKTAVAVHHRGQHVHGLDLLLVNQVLAVQNFAYQ